MKASTPAVALALLIGASALPALAAEPPNAAQRALARERQRVEIYRAWAPNAELARRAAITFHAELLESNYKAGYLVLELDGAGIAQLQSFGFRIEPADDFVARRDRLLDRLATQRNPTMQSIPSYSCYETVEETLGTATTLATAHPTLARVENIGTSWQKTQGSGGYDLRVLKITNNAIGGPKPKLFVQAAIHAREYTTAPMALEFARWLINGYGVDPDATWIVDHHEVHLLLQANPDGRKKAEAGLSWRKNTNTAYCGPTSNNRGADLNRNFSFSWNSTNGQGSSGAQCDLTYRGPSAASEPEVQAIERYIRGLWDDRRGSGPADPAPADTSGIHIDLHSYSQLVLWPWGTTDTPAPNGVALQTLGRKLAWFNGYTPQQSIGLYPTDGTSDGPSYGELGVAAFTIEMGTSFFQSCTTYNTTIKPANLQALIYAAKVVRTPYLTPSGPDVTGISLSNSASTAGVQAGTPVTLTATATDTRFNNSNGTEPVQAIASAAVYIDTPPWAGGTPMVLTAADGSYGSSSEGIRGVVSTGGLAPGDHLLYVQAVDASGQAGPVSAVFLKVADGPPVLAASFTSSCSQLACSFDAGASSGSISSYQWTFGDGSTGSGRTASRNYAASGSYSVTLTVSDGAGSASKTQVVNVTAIAITGLTSGGSGSNRYVQVNWSGATGSNVDIYRNGTRVARTANDGSQRITTGRGTWTFQVCNAGSTSVCSATRTITF